MQITCVYISSASLNPNLDYQYEIGLGLSMVDSRKKTEIPIHDGELCENTTRELQL